MVQGLAKHNKEEMVASWNMQRIGPPVKWRKLQDDKILNFFYFFGFFRIFPFYRG